MANANPVQPNEIQQYQEGQEQFYPDTKVIDVAFKCLSETDGKRLYMIAGVSGNLDGTIKEELTIHDANIYFRREDVFEDWLLHFTPEDQPNLRMNRATVREFLRQLIDLQNGRDVIIVMSSYSSFKNVLPEAHRPPNVRAVMNTPPALRGQDPNLAVGHLAKKKAEANQH